MADCKGCGAIIEWVVTVAGVSMPIDPDPVPDGNVEFTGRTASTSTGWSCPEVRVVAAGEQSLFAELEPDRYQAHFRFCPDAESFRNGETR